MINIENISVRNTRCHKKLKNKMTSGPDLMPSFCHILFNLSLKTVVFPNQWKVTKASPIFKAGDISIISNYRQISLLYNFAKILEIILYNRIYLSTKTYYHRASFMSNRLSITNLVTFSQTIFDALDKRGHADVFIY